MTGAPRVAAVWAEPGLSWTWGAAADAAGFSACPVPPSCFLHVRILLADGPSARRLGPVLRRQCGVRACPSKVSPRVRRETGKRRGWESLTMNGRANHIGPESCVSRREVWGEALTGVSVGQVLSHVTKSVRDADAVRVAEGSTVGCAIASALPVPRGLRPWHADETSCSGTGRSHVWPSEEGRSVSGRLEGRS